MFVKQVQVIWYLLKEAVLEFIDNNSLQKGAALAYYTIFALPPMLIIIINAAGYFFGERAVSGEIYYQIKKMIGSEGAYEVQKMVENVNNFTDINFTTMIGITTLFVAATGVFISLQDSLNEIWCVRPNPRRAYLKLLRDRVLSFGMILAMAILLLLSLLINTLLVLVSDFLTERFSGWVVYVLHTANFLINFLITTFMFACIYKYLPDVKIRWRDVWVGALVTSLLFSIGRVLIGTFLGRNDVGSIYGAAGSVIVILIWVFFTSQIVFFGAVCTFIYSRRYGHNIYPADYAVRVVRQLIEVGHTAVNTVPGKHAKEIYGEEDMANLQQTNENISAGENI